jgi:ribonuclease HI
MCALYIIVPYVLVWCVYFLLHERICFAHSYLSCFVLECIDVEHPFPYTLDLQMVLVRQTQNLASATWTIYHSGELVSSGGICLGPATNNVAEYHVMIRLLTEDASLGISHIIVNLDSQLMVRQLNHIYSICNPTLLHLYLRVHHLERSFAYIEYQHISREFNVITDSLANYMLYWHLAHR